jgi:hypothetical protein
MSKRLKWVAYVASMEEVRNAYKIFVRRLEGKRLCGRPRHR